MRIGLYFGSFNPVHNGHLIIANYVVQNTDTEQVWLVLSPRNPQKKSQTLLNEYHRLFLVQTAVEDEPALKASDIEFRLPRPSYTIDTLTYLHEKFPQHTFSVIMGSDSFHNIASWKNFEQIIRHYPIIVYLRPGFPVKDRLPDANVTILKAPLLEISSTHIRENVKKGNSIRYLVPDKVMTEIERNGYYKNIAG
jgi:nicotinate-nucleotide adenylyltransferase